MARPLGPALKLLWSAQARLIPQQGLLVEPIAMLLTKPQDVSQANGDQISLRITNPDEPTHARITLSIAGLRPLDADHRQVQIARIFDMQLLPPTQAHWSLLLIRTLPLPIGIGVGSLCIGAQFVSVFAWSSWLARWTGSRTIETAIAFQTDQRPSMRQRPALAPKPAPSS